MKQLFQLTWIHIIANYTQKRTLFALILQWLYMYSILIPVITFAEEFNLGITFFLYPFLS